MNAEALSGKVLGTCTLQQLIGRGGMGAVFLAQQSRPRRQVAVKVLLPMAALLPNQRAAFLERFRRETDTAASLEHPNIMPVHEYGEQDGLAYLVMSYVSGGTLRDELNEGALPLLKVVAYLDQIAAALDFAHERGVIHRDVKPANILRTQEGRLLLTDFGLVKIVTEGQNAQNRLSEVGMPMGTPDYMAPEQVFGEDIDHRADLYSLGVILYHMVTGSVPFKGAMPMQVAVQHVHVPPPSPRTLRPDLPSSTEQVMLRALAKKPTDRYSSALDMVSAFRLSLEAAGISLGDMYSGTTSAFGSIVAARPRSLFDPQWQPGNPSAPKPRPSRNDIVSKTSMTLPSFSGLMTESVPALSGWGELQPPTTPDNQTPSAQNLSTPPSLLPINNTPLPANPSMHAQIPDIQNPSVQASLHGVSPTLPEQAQLPPFMSMHPVPPASPALPISPVAPIAPVSSLDMNEVPQLPFMSMHPVPPAPATPLDPATPPMLSENGQAGSFMSMPPAPPTSAEPGEHPSASAPTSGRLFPPPMRLPVGNKMSLPGLPSSSGTGKRSLLSLAGNTTPNGTSAPATDDDTAPRIVSPPSHSLHGLSGRRTAQSLWEYSPMRDTSSRQTGEEAATNTPTALSALEQLTHALVQPTPAAPAESPLSGQPGGDAVQFPPVASLMPETTVRDTPAFIEQSASALTASRETNDANAPQNAPVVQGAVSPQLSPNRTRKLDSGQLSESTSLMVPVNDGNGEGGIMKLVQAVKVVKVPIVGQPGRYLTGLLPVLTSTPEPGPLPPFLQKATEIKEKLKPHKKIVLIAAAIALILFSTGICLLTNSANNQANNLPATPTPDHMATATSQANATAQANMILSDSLQQNSHNWPVSSTGPQYYVFKDGAYHLSTGDSHPAIALLPDANLPATLTYTLSSYEIKGDHTSINNLFGMVLRYSTQQRNGKTASTFYCFEMLQVKGSGQYEFRKYDDSYGLNVYPWTRLWLHPFGNEYHFGDGPAYKNTVQIAMSGDKFTITVNGKQLGQVEDNSLTNGQIGMFVNQKGTEVAFSDLELTYK